MMEPGDLIGDMFSPEFADRRLCGRRQFKTWFDMGIAVR